MSGEVRVLLYHMTEDAAGIEAAYRGVSERLADVPGLLGNELVRSVTDPCGFVIMSSWSGLECFSAWQQGPDHRKQTEPLRRFRNTNMRKPFDIYQVVASYQVGGR